MKSELLNGSQPFTVRDMIDSLKFIYRYAISSFHVDYFSLDSNKVAVEFTHIKCSERMDFISSSLEGDFMRGKLYKQEDEDMKHSLRRIAWATMFEEFIHQKWQDKRCYFVCSVCFSFSLRFRFRFVSFLKMFLCRLFGDSSWFLTPRFGCDGAEVIIPGLLTMVDSAAHIGVLGKRRV
jgi:2-oxoglutarate dehydrogenase complex dehydrogenase (E1) component-like enzyme